MNKAIGPDVPYDALCATVPGIAFFAAGITISDIYVFVAGALLITMGIVISTGARIVNRIDTAARDPKSDGSRLSVLHVTR